MNLSKKDREQLRVMFGGRCAYCGCELPAKGWHADHVDAVVRDSEYRNSSYENGVYKPARFVQTGKVMRPENDHIDNIYPACCACNINKSSMPLEQWRKFLTDGPESLASYNGRFRHMVRFGVVAVNPEPLTFWFERYTAELEATA